MTKNITYVHTDNDEEVKEDDDQVELNDIAEVENLPIADQPLLSPVLPRDEET